MCAVKQYRRRSVENMILKTASLNHFAKHIQLIEIVMYSSYGKMIQ